MRHCKKKIAERELKNFVSLIFFIITLLATFFSLFQVNSQDLKSVFVVLYFFMASAFSLFLCLTYAKDL